MTPCSLGGEIDGARGVQIQSAPAASRRILTVETLRFHLMTELNGRRANRRTKQYGLPEQFSTISLFWSPSRVTHPLPIDGIETVDRIAEHDEALRKGSETFVVPQYAGWKSIMSNLVNSSASRVRRVFGRAMDYRSDYRLSADGGARSHQRSFITSAAACGGQHDGR